MRCIDKENNCYKLRGTRGVNNLIKIEIIPKNCDHHVLKKILSQTLTIRTSVQPLIIRVK